MKRMLWICPYYLCVAWHYISCFICCCSSVIISVPFQTIFNESYHFLAYFLHSIIFACYIKIVLSCLFMENIVHFDALVIPKMVEIAFIPGIDTALSRTESSNKWQHGHKWMLDKLLIYRQYCVLFVSYATSLE